MIWKVLVFIGSPNILKIVSESHCWHFCFSKYLITYLTASPWWICRANLQTFWRVNLQTLKVSDVRGSLLTLSQSASSLLVPGNQMVLVCPGAHCCSQLVSLRMLMASSLHLYSAFLGTAFPSAHSKLLIVNARLSFVCEPFSQWEWDLVCSLSRRWWRLTLFQTTFQTIVINKFSALVSESEVTSSSEMWFGSKQEITWFCKHCQLSGYQRAHTYVPEEWACVSGYPPGGCGEQRSSILASVPCTPQPPKCQISKKKEKESLLPTMVCTTPWKTPFSMT